MFKGTSKYFR